MRRVVTAFLATILVALSGTSFSQQSKAGGSTTSDGATIATAIVLDESDDEAAIAAESAWLKEHYPGCNMVSQGLLMEKGRYYDVIEITTASNETVKTYFDITKSFEALKNIFGKPN
ncbi:hypothetical protein [Dyella amyloliquefaciens]|uniref:hypothetical protein n=1 Tax=Dyella amyloliquefaciens TaxID=1770545 RepID=UPI00102E62CD|nr:hypothetical protein [Dyella amyloliquefaciens]